MTGKNENKDEIRDLPKKVSDTDATNVKGGYPPGPPNQKGFAPGPPTDLAV
ncbi:MAG: hypothetical protein M3Z54_09515 [Gemmatimonadota bacterium]|nr:hypothetical protein [Gemmatimonadota bacterium]